MIYGAAAAATAATAATAPTNESLRCLRPLKSASSLSTFLGRPDREPALRPAGTLANLNLARRLAAPRGRNRKKAFRKSVVQ